MVRELQSMVESLQVQVEQFQKRPNEYAESFINGEVLEMQVDQPQSEIEFWNSNTPPHASTSTPELSQTKSDLNDALECISLLQSSTTELEQKNEELTAEVEFLQTSLIKSQVEYDLICGEAKELKNALECSLKENQVFSIKLECNDLRIQELQNLMESQRLEYEQGLQKLQESKKLQEEDIQAMILATEILEKENSNAHELIILQKSQIDDLQVIHFTDSVRFIPSRINQDFRRNSV